MNDFSLLTERLVTELAAGLASSYTGIVVERRLFKPDNLPTFTRYCIVVSPAPSPWEERRIGIRQVHYVLRVELYVLVVNFHDTNALFGTAGADKGLFELINDIKTLMRTSTLSGALDKTYDEAGGDQRTHGGGPIGFQEQATGGFDAGEHSFIYRAKIPFVGRTVPFCHDK